MNPIAKLFRSQSAKAADRAAAALYAAAVEQARAVPFYARLGVPDTANGRFDLLALHVHLICRRLAQGGVGAVAQALFDALFADMDRNLREMGVGDLAVPKKIKGMAGMYYERAERVEAGLLGDDATLGAALAGALYGGKSPFAAQAATMAMYVRATQAALAQQAPAALASGRISFVPIPG